MTRHPIYWNTVNPSLRNILDAVMIAPEFDSFRLVGGTSLSLQHGHRVSVDIDSLPIVHAEAKILQN